MKSIDIDPEYGTNFKPISNFIKKVLPKSKHYWRVAGYFRSSVFNLIGDEVKDFCENGGHIKLLTSVELTEDDEKAIEGGESKRAILEKALEASLEHSFSSPLSNPELLEELIAHGKLEVRISIGNFEHRKKGIFFATDDLEKGEYVAFTGTVNDSANGYESQKNDIDVYKSWGKDGDRKRAYSKQNIFKKDWENKLDTITLSMAQAKRLIKRAGSGPGNQAGGSPAEVSEIDTIDEKWAHQEEAVDAFFAANGRGILSMATGTGKTRTAGKIARRLLQERKIDGVVVVSSNSLLLDQWSDQFGNKDNYPEIDGLIYKHYNSENGGNPKHYPTFKLRPKGMLLIGRHYFRRFADTIDSEKAKRLLVILDEVHQFKGESFRRDIGDNINKFNLRIGLSATPFTGHNHDGNDFLKEYLGDSFYEFGIKNAISKEILCPLRYTPLEFSLSEEDILAQKKINSEYAMRKNTSDPMSREEKFTKLARVTKVSLEKIPVFESFLNSNNPSLDRTIIFAETKEYGEKICTLLNDYMPGQYRTFFEGESNIHLKRFVNGELECLVTCSRIAEGIDIPSVKTVILFTADRPPAAKNYQRIGRALRTVKGSPEKTANVIDFVREDREAKSSPGRISSCKLRHDELVELSGVR